jgi:hypothetical protein
MIKFKHAHCYVYEFQLSLRDTSGYKTEQYSLLTNVDGHNNRQNREWLEQGLRAAYGYMPKHVRFKFDKYK